MPRAGRSTLLLFLAGSALFFDMFLRWGPSSTGGYGGNFMGWDVPLASTGGFLALALALVEFVRLQTIWWTTTSSLLGFFLAGGSAFVVISGLVHLRWGALLVLRFGEFAYGAWIGAALCAILLVGSWLRLSEHRDGAAS